MLSEITMTTPVGATLTEAELFGLLIDSPVLENATLSTLTQSKESKISMTKSLFGFFGSFCFDDYELPQNIIESLREQNDPAYELQVAINDLAGLVGGLKTLQREFDCLMEDTLKEPEETGDAELDKAAWKEWDKSPRRYVLPVSVELKGTQQH